MSQKEAKFYLFITFISHHNHNSGEFYKNKETIECKKMQKHPKRLEKLSQLKPTQRVCHTHLIQGLGHSQVLRVHLNKFKMEAIQISKEMVQRAEAIPDKATFLGPISTGIWSMLSESMGQEKLWG